MAWAGHQPSSSLLLLGGAAGVFAEQTGWEALPGCAGCSFFHRADWPCPPDLHSHRDLPWATVSLVRGVTEQNRPKSLSWAAIRKHRNRCEAAGGRNARAGVVVFLLQT